MNGPNDRTGCIKLALSHEVSSHIPQGRDKRVITEFIPNVCQCNAV